MHLIYDIFAKYREHELQQERWNARRFTP